MNTIPAAEIVVGDILEFEPGDLVAADARLIEAASLQCMEAPLTGESAPVVKRAVILPEDLPLADRENMVFMGTSVSGGVGSAIVVATGMDTEIGRIATLIETAAEEDTPLQKRLEAFGRTLVWVALGLVALLFVLGWARGLKLFELFMTSVSLAVAAVPEGLPAVVTIALALGVMRMSRRGALVRRLPAVETLGSTTVVCTDKTGTLTIGDMTVRELHVAGSTFVVTGEGYGPHGEILLEGKPAAPQHATPLLELANVLIGCNNAHLVLEDDRWEVIGDPTEGALLAAGHKAGGCKENLEKELPKHHEIPFDSDRKRRTVLRLMPNERLRAFTNGAPDLLLYRCSHLLGQDGVRTMMDQDRKSLTRENDAMANRGLRVLGSAYRDLSPDCTTSLTADAVERELVFVGLAGMYDPPRPEAKEAVVACRNAGIRVVMITGDHPHTALAIARELGIASTGNEVLTGFELERLSDEELGRRVAKTSVFARVTAEHKLRIVRAWKANGAVVAMTGDGVNDAPALKGADIGIAMGRSGTEVTKQASDMVITDDNFATIVAAIEEGRGVYANIRKTLEYLLATNAGELLFITFCLAVGMPLPLLPIHLLWINLVTDGLPALSLATSPLDRELLQHPPRPAPARLADRPFLLAVALTGFTIAVTAWAVYSFALRTEEQFVARTYAFGAIVFSQLFCAFGFLNENQPLLRQARTKDNSRLALTIIGTLVLQIALFRNNAASHFFKTSILSWENCLWLGLVSLVPLTAFEIAKARARTKTIGGAAMTLRSG